MITFNGLSLRNFLSFESLDITLDGFSGPVLVLGENQDSTSASSNGSGKSGLLEGIPWALYGFTLRGLTPKEVVRRGSAGGCSASLRFEITSEGEGRDGAYQVERYQDHSQRRNSLILGRDGCEVACRDKRGVQQAIEDLLGFDFKLFCQSVILGQDSLTFAGATDAEKKRILESVTGIDRFDVFLEETKRRLSEEQETQQILRTQLQSVEAAEYEVSRGLESAKTTSAHFASEQSARIERLRQDRQREDDRVATAESIQTQLDAIKFDPERVEQARQEVNEARSVSEATLKRYSTLEGEYSASRREQAQIQAKLRDLKDVCPTCKRPFAPEDLAATRETYKGQQDALCIRMRDQEESIDIAKGKNEVATASDKAATSKFQVLQAEQGELKKRKVELESELKLVERAKAQCATIQAQIQAEKTQRNPAADEVVTLTVRLDTIASEKVKMDKQLGDLNVVIQYLEFWVEGFGKKGVRCYLLDRAANALNAYAAKYSQCLTDGEIEVSFKVQRPLATGEMTEDFQVQGLNRYGSDVYKGNSVGERQRVDMCVALALQDFIRSRLSTGVNLFVCDEAAANLDRDGSERMLDLLHEISKDGRNVFYVTHDPQVQDLFEHTLCVVKSNGVSRVKGMEE